MKYLTLLICLFVLSCSDTKEELQQKINSKTEVGTLPDGRKIFVIERWISGNIHYIYFVDNTVTSNYPIGKSRGVSVYIDEVEYKPAEKE